MLRSISLFTLVALFLFFEMALQVSPGIMTDDLMLSLNIDVFWLGIASGTYFITYTLMQIPAGLFYDRFSARNVIMLPLLICIIGGFLFGIAGNFYVAAAARICMGFGSAFAYIGVLVVASHVFDNKHFTLISGITQLLAALGAMCGALPLLPMIGYFGWRNTMLLISSSGIIVLLLMYLFLHLPKEHSIKKPVKSWVAFKSVAQKRQTWVVAVYVCLLWMPMSVVASLYGIPFIKQYFDMQFSSAVLIITCMWIGIGFGSPIAGFIADKTQQLKSTLTYCAFIGVLAFGAIMFIPIKNAITLACLFFIAGASCAGQAISFSLVSRNNKTEHQGTAIGFNNMAIVISGFIFQPLVGYIIRLSQSQPINDNYLYDGGSYHTGMLIVFAGYIISTLTSMFLIKNFKLKNKNIVLLS